VALVLVLLIAVLAGLAGWYLGVARYTTTPGVLGLRESAARARLHTAGLDLRIADTAYSETVAKGAIARTSPAPGDRVRKEGTVSAVVSLGPERHAVPDVRGKLLDDAQQQLADAKLEYGDAVRRFDEKVPTGSVITTDPVPGTPLPRGTAVDVIVSKGPRPVAIPDFTGKPADTATTRLTVLGFKVDTEEVNSDTVAKGRIVSQSPNTGTGQKGDTVSLVVSKGPELVTVPNVVRMGTAAATQALRNAGFQVEVRRSSLFIGVQYVVGQNPGSGERAPRGSTVVINVV
jgi:serine/threonine-protein kinase